MFIRISADVGGMLGLFLGASVFTIIDFIRYVINYTYKEYKTRFKDEDAAQLKRRKRRSKSVDSVTLNGKRSRGETGSPGTKTDSTRRQKLKMPFLPTVEHSRSQKSPSNSGDIDVERDELGRAIESAHFV